MPCANPITMQQQAVINFIKKFKDDKGYPPTRAEIARGMGFKSANAAECHLKALARKGALFIASGTARGITLA